MNFLLFMVCYLIVGFGAYCAVAKVDNRQKEKDQTRKSKLDQCVEAGNDTVKDKSVWYAVLAFIIGWLVWPIGVMMIISN